MSAQPFHASRFVEPAPEATRFWAKVAKDTTSGCWLWMAGLWGGGYGRFRRTRGGPVGAHVWAYEDAIGPVPEGLQLDHLCRVRRCVNPAHLEPVTPQENVLRSPITLATRHASKTHCAKGHPFDEANTHHFGGARGYRRCRRCAADAQARYRARSRAR